MIRASFFVALLLAASAWDIRKREIPGAIPLLIVATGLMFEFSPVRPVGVLAALPLFIAGIAREGSIGGGDVKLMAAAGTVLGLSAGLFSLCAGLLAAVVFHLGRRIAARIRKQPRTGPAALPLAPFLSLGCVLSLIT